MLGKADATPMIPVTDLDRARTRRDRVAAPSATNRPAAAAGDAHGRAGAVVGSQRSPSPWCATGRTRPRSPPRWLRRPQELRPAAGRTHDRPSVTREFGSSSQRSPRRSRGLEEPSRYAEARFVAVATSTPLRARPSGPGASQGGAENGAIGAAFRPANRG